jgi:hypothetical protein
MLAVIRDYLELTYFASGPALLVVALLGLRQLHISREALEATKQQVLLATASLEQTQKELGVRALREAVVLAAERCQICAETLIPDINACLERLGRLTPTRHWSLLNTDLKWQSFESPEEAKQYAEKILGADNAQNDAMKILNALEGFAMYFAQGAADETVAFPVMGVVFCDVVRVLAPMLALLREGSNSYFYSGSFENTVTLFRTWYVRLWKADLKRESANMEQEYAKNRAASPIGLA